MLRWLLLHVVLAALLLSGIADAAEYEPVHVRAENGDEGNGARFRVADGCITITADHLLRNSVGATISPARDGYNRANLGSRDGGLDVALLTQPTVQSSTCPVFPTREQIANAIRGGGVREVRYVDAGGSELVIPVMLLASSATELTLTIQHNPSLAEQPMFKPGMSGSIVVFDGVPVGTLQRITFGQTPKAVATRLDETIRMFGSTIPMPATTESRISRHKPYDISILPRKYRDVVLDARKTQRRAEAARKDAEIVMQRARDAADIARQYPRGRAQNGYAHFEADNGNDYAGQVRQVGSSDRAHGYGVSITGSVQHKGDEYYCQFEENKGCAGLGVVIYRTNPSNTTDLEAYYGGLSGSKWVGYGYKSHRDGDAAEWWLYHDAGGRPNPGVCNERAGTQRRYQGYMRNGWWDGLGVLWDADGQVQMIGTWAEGMVQTDETDAWRAGTLQ